MLATFLKFYFIVFFGVILFMGLVYKSNRNEGRSKYFVNEEGDILEEWEMQMYHQ